MNDSTICEYLKKYDYSLFSFHQLIYDIYSKSNANLPNDKIVMKTIVELLFSCLEFFREIKGFQYYDILFTLADLCPSIRGHILCFMRRNSIGTESFQFHVNSLIFDFYQFNNQLLNIEDFVTLNCRPIFHDNNWFFHLNNLIDVENNSFKVDCLNSSLKFLQKSRFIDLRLEIEDSFFQFVSKYEQLKLNRIGKSSSNNSGNLEPQDFTNNNISMAISSLKASPRIETKKCNDASKTKLLNLYDQYSRTDLERIEELIVEQRTASSSQTSGKSEQLKEEEQICNKSNNNNNNNAAADFECSQKLITIFEADEPLSVNFGKQIPKSSNKLIHSNEPQNILRRIDGSVLGNRRKNCQEFNATLNVPNNDQTENATWKKSTVANADETSFMLSSFLRSSDLSDENLEVQETKNKVEEKKKKPMVQNDETTFVLSKFLQSSDISTEDYQKDAAGNEENLQPPEEKRIAEPSRESKSRMDENCSNLEDLGSKKLDVMFQAATKKNQCFEKLDKSISELKVKSFVIPQIIDENCSELDLMQQKVDLAEKKEFKAPRKSFASSTEKIDDSIIGRALANIDQLKAGSLEGIRNSSYATDKNVPKQKPLNILSNKKGSGTTCEEKTELSFFQRPPIAASTTNLDTNLVNKALKKSLEIQQNNKYNNDQQPTCKFLKPFTQAFQEEYHEFVKSSFLQNCVAQYPHSFDPNSRFNTRLPDIGTFRVKKQVAEGGFGKVYLAYCDGPKISKICIKACDDKYLKEIAISRVIQQKHSNLILRTKSQSFLDITQALIFNTCVLYVSEWLQGGTLSDLVDFVDKTYTPYLQIESLTLICHELCLIVDALAKMNIIHLDIKPDNFMLRIPSTDWKELSKCNPKNSCFLVLIDYGNAVDLNRFDPNVKCSGSIPTLNFACPQMLKSQLWTFEPDTFNLGLVIYFLIFKELFVVKERDNKVAKLIPRHLRGNNLWLNITNELLESRADANISYYAIELNKERQKLDLMPKDLVDYFISRIK